MFYRCCCSRWLPQSHSLTLTRGCCGYGLLANNANCNFFLKFNHDYIWGELLCFFSPVIIHLICQVSNNFKKQLYMSSGKLNHCFT